jgi:hypothetical protein
MKEVLSQSKAGVRLVNEMIKGVEDIIKEQNYMEAMNIFHNDLEDVTNQTDDDDLEDFLGNLGISLSGDDDDDDDDGGIPA